MTVGGSAIRLSGALLISAEHVNGSGHGNAALGSSNCTSGVGTCASAYSHGGGVGAALAGGIMQAGATIQAPLDAELNGTVTSALSVTVRSIGANDAESQTLFAGIGAISFSADESNAQVTNAATVTAKVGSAGSITTTGSASGSCGSSAGTGVCVAASTTNRANSQSDGATGGLVGFNIAEPKAGISGNTEADFNGTVVSGSGVTISAIASNVAESRAALFAIGLGAGNGGAAAACIGSFSTSSGSCSTGDALTRAYVGSTGQLGHLNGTAPSISGAVNVIAQGTNSATATMTATAGGLVGIQAVSPKAEDFSTTAARIDGNVGGVHPRPTSSAQSATPVPGSCRSSRTAATRHWRRSSRRRSASSRTPTRARPLARTRRSRLSSAAVT